VKKYSWFFVAAALVGLALAGVAAQTPARPAVSSVTPNQPPKAVVAVVDFAAVQKSVASVGDEPLEQYRSRRMAELDTHRDAIRALQLRIVQGGESLSAEAREETLQDIRRQQDALRQAEQVTQRDLQARSDLSEGAIRELIRKIAAERGLQLVLDRGAAAVLWNAATIDLTADVVNALKQASRPPVK
jgi:Skp family chaperone for outer membrane proteins